jgi:pimeloyl-ACP methyl ester carboxylesterase
MTFDDDHGQILIEAASTDAFNRALSDQASGRQRAGRGLCADRRPRVAARSLLSFSWRRPVRRAGSVRIPFLLVVPEADAIAPVPAALEVARRAPGAELFRSGGGHYDVYEGGASFADVLRTEIDFLHRHAKVATRKM